ncbi:MAG: Flp pilus assembly complex ATPase component TadA [Planctomycetes bacterium]|nr:Flp pilus assembly complex ATPase component TadA [Planctomycetota bacterium]
MTTPPVTQAMAIDWPKVCVPAEYLERIPLRFAREHAIVAVAKAQQNGYASFVLATPNPDRYWVHDRIAYKLDAEVDVLAAPEREVLDLIGRAYHAEAKEVHEVADELAAASISGGEITLTEDVLELDDKAPAVKLVHAMLLQAVKQRASDIHIEPAEDGVRVRFRIDGVLYERVRLRPEVREGIASRIKVMGRMDIAEKRLPQDGGVTIRIGDHRIDLRIATLPSQYGERIVLRLLDKQTGLLSLEGLGLTPENHKRVRTLLDMSHGIILVTGPTGCGKTTTLYGMLSAMNSAELNILTLEDPVEYQLPGVSQTQVSEKKGLTFAKGLRALVRQDPDIIMVGEIRDLETASVAIQSALTGHLVLSTLHTNDAPSSVMRLLDLGVEPFLVASSVNAAIAQRLVRRACTACRQPMNLDLAHLRIEGWQNDEIEFLSKLPNPSFVRGVGCDVCFKTGFSGRTGIYEMLFMNDDLRELIGRRASAAEIKRAALERGMLTLRRDGLRKAAEGVTTLAEVRAVTQLDLE